MTKAIDLARWLLMYGKRPNYSPGSTNLCRCCGAKRPADGFHAITHNPDGDMHYWCTQKCLELWRLTEKMEEEDKDNDRRAAVQATKDKDDVSDA